MEQESKINHLNQQLSNAKVKNNSLNIKIKKAESWYIHQK